jgi:DUF3014 family protein
MDEGERNRRGGWLIALLVSFVLAIPAGIGFLAYRMLNRAPTPPAALPPTRAAQTPAEAPATTPPAASRTPLPALDASDSFVRELVEALSANPSWATWLATEGLVRRFAVVVDNVAEGIAPTKHVGMVTPKGKFAVVERGKTTLVDPKSYDRYALVAEVVASLDAAGCAKAYRELKPLVQQAYRDLGYPDRDFDATLARAIDRLLATPAPTGDVELRPTVKSYRYADPALESLTPAQKQFLRMGPDNVKKVQQKLRELREQLGLPKSREASSR